MINNLTGWSVSCLLGCWLVKSQAHGVWVWWAFENVLFVSCLNNSSLICHCLTVTVQLSLFSCHCPTVTVQMSLSNCHCSTVTVQLPLFHCHCSAVTVQLSLFSCHCLTVTVQLSLFSCHCSALVVMKVTCLALCTQTPT